MSANEKLSMDALGRLSKEDFKQSRKNNIIVILENIRSAYNVGSVFRTADAFLIDAVYLTGYTAKPPHKEIKKTALGAEETVTWQGFENGIEAVKQAELLGYKPFAIEQTKQAIALHEFEYPSNGKVALIFGNEVTGVEQATIDYIGNSMEIPQWGTKHSLNIATAAGIVLWEMIRKKL